MTDSSLVLIANAGDGSISSFRLSGGSLERLAVTAGVTGCSTFAVDPSRGLVYAAVKGSDEGEPAGILTLRLDRETGELTPGSRRDLPDGGMNYLALTPDGTGLLGASYHGGYGIVAPVEDGVVGEITSRIAFPNLHAVITSEDGRFAYFVSLGGDLVAQYSLTDDKRLKALKPETVAAPEGSGPRHLVMNDAQNAVYVLTEFSGQVLHYARDPQHGTLQLQDAADAFDPSKGLSHSRIGADPRAEHLIWGADLHFGSGNRQLWCSERTASTLGAVAVADIGTVSPPERFVETQPQPRGFALSPDGAYLVAAGERSTAVALYAVTDDSLELLEQAETGGGANWVRFV